MHAFVMTAYQRPDIIRRVLRVFGACGLCYVHMDKSAGLENELPSFREIPNVTAESVYRTNWGSINHLNALLRGARILLRNPEVTHVHLMSAQDMPTVSMKKFEAFFEGNDRIYLQNLVTADYPELVARYEHFYFMHLFNYRDNSEKNQNFLGHIDRIQDILHIKRKLNLPRKGIEFSSMPRDAIEYALKQKALLRKIRYTYIPEEFFFQNAFFGTPFESRVTGDDQRYTIWDDPTRGAPAFLDMRDLPQINTCGKVLCRKVIDAELMDVLEKRWFSET